MHPTKITFRETVTPKILTEEKPVRGIDPPHPGTAIFISDSAGFGLQVCIKENSDRKPLDAGFDNG